MNPETETYFSLLAVWITAQGHVKTAAWRALVDYLVANPRAYAFLVKTKLTQAMIVEVEKALLKAFAAKGVQRGLQATCGSGMRLFAARLGMNFAVSPKVPLPQAQLVLTIAIALGTFGQAYAETNRASQKYPAYEQYLINYVQFTGRSVHYHPSFAKNLAEPKTFEEWLAENQ